ncbi:MAG: amino acid adenylation domain-containing protein, partial [Alteromonadaceae bacterium]|nr:amino acid adenylation domain-containing protein [Alteromonadaceae bacterium]
ENLYEDKLHNDKNWPDSNRLYKTGDLVRRLADGNLEFAGRNDHQVKISGFRIEPGEIAHVLASQEGVNDAVVLAKENTRGDSQLVAYVVVNNTDITSGDDKQSRKLRNETIAVLRQAVKLSLPEYMVPSAFVLLADLPLTPNGKLNREALPDPDIQAQLQDQYVAPRTLLETQLCAVWEKVLGISRVGINDNLFRLGGNSIAAVRLTAISRREMGLDIPLALLFEHKTIATIAPLLNQEDKLVISKLSAEHYDLSFAQERMLFIEQFEQGTDAYHIPYCVQLTSDVNIKMLEQSFDALINRHPILRTVYRVNDEGNGYQVIIDNQVKMISFVLTDHSELVPAIKEGVGKPFDLTSEQGMRLHIYQSGESTYLLIVWHHIAFDGWSSDIFMQELAQCYQTLCQGQTINLPELEISYGDYALWQRQTLQGEKLKSLEDYWLKQLSSYDTLALPTDFARPKQFNYQGQVCEFSMEPKLSAELRDLAQEQETTLYTVLLSAFYLTLATVSGQRDILVGTPSDNRHQAQIQSLIGLFVNTLALRVELDGTVSIEELITQVHEVIMQAKVHQDLPFEKLLELLDIERDLSRSPIFQVMFGLQDFGAEVNKGLPFEGDSFESAFATPAKFDLELFISDSQSQLTGRFTYAQSLFTEQTIKRFSGVYQKVLQAFVSNKNQSLCQIEKLSAQDHQQLALWNNTQVSYETDKCIHELFEQQVKLNPERIAVVFDEQSLTYTELNARANRLARYLVEDKQIKADTLVGICVERSIDMLVGIFAILKAGGAYVPMDPAYPEARLSYLLSDASLTTVLTQMHLSECTPVTDNQAVYLDNPVFLQDLQQYSPDDLSVSINVGQLAYVIYTSGSTGQPKGVTVEHHSVANLAFNLKSMELSASELASSEKHWGWLASFAFDASIKGISQLILGQGLTIISDACKRDPHALKAFLPKLGVIDCTPSIVEIWFEAGLEAHLPNLIIGGEAISQRLWTELVSWQSEYGRKAFNVYGPTECTVNATQSLVVGDKPHIGKSLANTLAYVLDHDLGFAPVGTFGELYIGGVGLARGYLNKPELTEASFIPNPYYDEHQPVSSRLLYKTGDLVRRLADGNLEYSGRNDHQVKIRGFRIELGEIAHVLASQDGVNDATVVAKTSMVGDDQLVAYVVMDNADIISGEDKESKSLRDEAIAHLRHAVKLKLPEYMEPSVFVLLTQLPLTPNGKLDQKALPEPDFQAQMQDQYVAPRTVLETQLCAVWEKVLGISRVGIDDNFFRLGGNSIAAVRLTAISRREIGLDIPLVLLFEHKTIAAIAPLLSQEDKLVIPKVAVEHYDLSFAQERMLFIEQFEQGTDAYHIPYCMQLTSDVNIKMLEQSFELLINRHPILRTVYRVNDEGDGYQAIIDNQVKLNSFVLTDQSELMPAIKEGIAKPFDLTSEQGIRLQRYQSGESAYLLIVWHHIAFDGWSSDIFMQEFAQCYQTLCQGQTVNLPELEISYGDYALWQRQTLQGEKLKSLEDYWLQQLSCYETLALPTDFVRPKQFDYRGEVVEFTLGTELSAELRDLAQEQETTLYTVLLSGFYLTLATVSGQHDILIGTPSDNRHHAQIQSLIGLFVNTLALRVDLDGQASIEHLIAQVHEVVMQAKVHQDLPFEKLLELLDVDRDLSRSPVFQVMFGLQDFGIDVNKGLPFTGKPLESDLSTPAKFDLNLFISDSQSQLRGGFTYAMSLFTEQTIKGFSEIYQKVLQAFVTNKQQPICKIDKLSAQEHQQLALWNNTQVAYETDKCIHELFEQQVKHNSEGIAVAFDNHQLTYGELNAKANRLARYLVEHKQVKADTLVGICVERSVDMLVGIFAILKAGGAYVPMDPAYPEARLSYLLSDAGLTTVLTQVHLSEATPIADHQAVYIDEPAFLQDLQSYSSDNLSLSINSDKLAYVIYTSGSTGQPKGVMVEHQSVANLALNLKSLDLSSLDTTSDKHWGWLASFAFDASIQGISQLALGQGLTIISEDCKRDPEALMEVLPGLSVIDCTPSMVEIWFDAGIEAQLPNLIIGGEAISQKLWTQLVRWQSEQGKKAVNVYGPTECTVNSTQCLISGDKPHIGMSLANTHAYVLDRDLGLAPVGTFGELYIGGGGLARGYLNKPELTVASFIDNPYDDKKQPDGRRLYKTGDLVRRLADGNLEFAGRNDHQVKIRGYRIEPGEIAHLLASQAGVNDAVVVPKTGFTGDDQLVAYLVVDSTDILSGDDEQSRHLRNEVITSLREAVKLLLPEYMVPSAFVLLTELPLTPNGKLNRDALPDPDIQAQIKDQYVAPSNDTEEKLCQIWQKLLGIEQAGITDDFFDLGGHSLSATKMSNMINLEFGVRVKLKDIFEVGTIEKISEIIVHLFATGGEDDQQRVFKFHQDEAFDMENFEL